MPTLDITLPADVKALVDRAVASGRYRSASDYVKNLILEEEIRQTEEAELEALLRGGLDCGPATDLTPQDWQDIRQEGLARIKERQRRCR